jgi:hypothetical protein
MYELHSLAAHCKAPSHEQANGMQITNKLKEREERKIKIKHQERKSSKSEKQFPGLRKSKNEGKILYEKHIIKLYSLLS